MKISGKHSVEEINGIRCSVIEKESHRERAAFLQAVMEHNGYTVQVQKNNPPPVKPKPGAPVAEPVPAPETFKVGVSELQFNVAVMIYSRKLKTLENKILLPTYWTGEDPGYDGWYLQWNKNKF